MKDTVVQWFKEAGYDGKVFEYPYYSRNKEVKENFGKFENNTEDGLKLLFVVDKLNEGLHLDDIQGCILLRTTTSNVIYYQQIGRAIDAGSKQKRVILDLVSNFNNLKSFNLKDELQKKIIERQKGKFIECDSKFNVNEFHVDDYVQPCVDVFDGINSRINPFYNDWSKEEEKLLIKYFPKIGAANIVKKGLLSRHNYGAIKMKAYSLNLKYNIKGKYIPNEEDDKILIEKYSQFGRKAILKYLPHMNENEVKHRAKQLGLVFDNKKWTDEDERFLVENYALLTLDEMSNILHRSKAAICSHASKNGITSDRSVNWKDTEDEILMKLYPIYGSKMFNQLPNKTKQQISDRIRKLNIKKNNGKTSSKYKYVTKLGNKWIVQFSIKGQNIKIGSFYDEDEAGSVAMEKAKEYGKVI